MNKKIAIIGSGHWGLTLGDVATLNGYNVLSYARDQDTVLEINEKHTLKKYFDEHQFSHLLKATNDIEKTFLENDVIVISLPVKAICDTILNLVKKYPNKIYVLTSKGLYKGRNISSYFYEIKEDIKLCVLSGPSFAEEVIKKRPTAVVASSNDSKTSKEVQHIFNTRYFRVYTSDDVVGVEYLGAIKNVFAIICGMIDKANLGPNARSAVICRGVHEMKRIVLSFGGKEKSLYGLTGLGDIILTCTSPISRNYQYGFYYYDKEKRDNIKGTVEGINTAKEIYQLAKAQKIETPIIDSLYRIIFEDSTIDKEIKCLMTRDVKEEN